MSESSSTIIKSKIYDDANSTMDFYRSALILAIPMAIQGLATASLNFIDVLMLSSLGDLAVSAAGINSQLFFVFMMIVFGISGGLSIFASQLYGVNDLDGIRRYQTIALLLNFIVTVTFLSIILFAPKFVIRLYTADPVLQEEAIKFLKISYPAYAVYFITSVYSQALRSTKNMRIPLLSTVSALIINTLLNYCLIYGNFGFPKIGMEGAAYATSIARILEVGFILGSVYYSRHCVALKLIEIIKIKIIDFKKFIIVTWPMFIQTCTWVIGTNIYFAIYSRSGLDSLTAINIVTSIEKICLIVFTALGQAIAIILGHRIANSNKNSVTNMAVSLLRLSLAVSLGFSIALLLLNGILIDLYSTSPGTKENIRTLLSVAAFVLVLKSINITIFLGILRSGGDTKFVMCMDLMAVWLIGIPAALIGVFYFQLPIYQVVLLVSLEELIKTFAGFYRIKSQKWINVV